VRYLGRALSEFHAHKNIFLQNGARHSKKSNLNHFQIPKIAAMHAYVYHIPQMGSSPQFSTEISETLHQTMAKKAYRLSNRRAFEIQMCRYLDRIDKIVQMNNFLEWATPILRERRIAMELEQYPQAYHERALEGIRATLDAHLQVPLGRTKQGQPSRIWHALTPHSCNIAFTRIYKHYNIPQIYLSSKICQFLQEEGAPVVHCATTHLDIWHYFRIQLPTVQEFDLRAQSRTVQALPPTDVMPYGRGDCVLVHDTEDAGPTGIQGKSNYPILSPLTNASGYRVAQVKLIFRLLVPPTHPYYHVPLAFVSWFSRSLPQTEQDVKMYAVKRLQANDGSPCGAVIDLQSVARFVQLIPRFRGQLNPQMTQNNVMDCNSIFLVNSFLDKETYQAVY
jgi:hypothetical protein